MLPSVKNLWGHLYYGWLGIRSTLRFSNGWALLWRRFLSRGFPVLVYVWDNRLSMVCQTKFYDHDSAKELLAEGAYDEYLQVSGKDGELAYVNIGAHIGCFDLAVLKNHFEIPYALSVELNPLTYHRLCYNLDLNGLDQIYAVNAGVAKEPGQIKMAAQAYSRIDSIYLKPGEEDREVATRDVRLDTLASLLEEAGLAGKDFHLLKVDCEGAEYEIFESLDAEALRPFANIVMELHPPQGDLAQIDQLYAKLAGAGFTTKQPQWDPREGNVLRFWSRE